MKKITVLLLICVILLTVFAYHLGQQSNTKEEATVKSYDTVTPIPTINESQIPTVTPPTNLSYNNSKLKVNSSTPTPIPTRNQEPRTDYIIVNIPPSQTSTSTPKIEGIGGFKLREGCQVSQQNNDYNYVKQIQDSHKTDLLNIRGSTGNGITSSDITGIGNGYQIVVYLLNEASSSNVPCSLDGVQVVYKVTGEIIASGGSGSGGSTTSTQHTTSQPTVVQTTSQPTVTQTVTSQPTVTQTATSQPTTQTTIPQPTPAISAAMTYYPAVTHTATSQPTTPPPTSQPTVTQTYTVGPCVVGAGGPCNGGDDLNSADPTPGTTGQTIPTPSSTQSKVYIPIPIIPAPNSTG